MSHGLHWSHRSQAAKGEGQDEGLKELANDLHRRMHRTDSAQGGYVPKLSVDSKVVRIVGNMQWYRSSEVCCIVSCGLL